MTVKEGLLETHPPDRVGMVPAGSQHHISRQVEGRLGRDAGENPVSVTSCQTGISIPLTSEELTFEGLA